MARVTPKYDPLFSGHQKIRMFEPLAVPSKNQFETQ